jgi:hypothetical protein
VKAIAPNAPIGASRMTMPTSVKSTPVARSDHSSIGLARGPHRGERHPREHPQKEHLEHVALGERPHERLGDDREQVRDEARRLPCLSRGQRRVERLRVEARDVGMNPATGRTACTTTIPSPSATVVMTSK